MIKRNIINYMIKFAPLFISYFVISLFNTSILYAFYAGMIVTIGAAIIVFLFKKRKTIYNILIVIIATIVISVAHQIVFKNLKLLGVFFYFICIVVILIYCLYKTRNHKKFTT